MAKKAKKPAKRARKKTTKASDDVKGHLLGVENPTTIGSATGGAGSGKFAPTYRRSG